MRILFTTSLVFVCIHVHAQPPCMAFHDLHGGMGASVRAIATDAEGATYITGAFADSVTFGDQVIHGVDYNLFVAKFDPTNELVWISVFASNMFSAAVAIALDGSGGLVVTGDFMDQLSLGTCTAFHPGGSDIFVAKLNTDDGACQWSTTGNCIGDAHARALTIASDGTIRIAGGFHGYCTFGSTTLTCTGTMSPFIAAYAADGTAIWAKQVVDGTGGESEGVCTDASGNTYMVGSHGSTGNFGNGITLSPGGYFVAKYDAAGEAQWARQGMTTGAYLAVACNATGAVYVQHNNPTGVVKFSGEGDTLWNRSWSGYGATAFGVSDDHAWLSLWYTNPQIIGTDTLTASSTTSKVALAEFDGLGALVGLYGSDNQGLSRETPLALCFDASGRPVVGGTYDCTTTNVPDTILGLPDYVGPFGATAPFVLRACSTTGMDQAPVPTHRIHLFPNPASTSVAAEYELLPGIDEGLFRLLDIQGQVVQRATLRGHTGRLDLDVRSLAPGSYIARVVTSAGSLPAQRVMVVR